MAGNRLRDRDAAGRRTARRGVFLDRDGTIIEEREYLADPERVSLVRGALEALRALREAGLALVVVTNQSGIARGYYREEDYRAVAARLDRILAAGGALPDGTYHCPHHPDFTGPCECRKPATGLFHRAAQELELDLAASFYVGDRVKDVIPALELGGTGILVRTGFGAEEAAVVPPAVEVADDLADAARLILERLRGAR
ncbi:MAG: HAD family hydrolase [Gemmatimonadetes bacterium]|nr:HAD family hydrolase [Gemmatimonadota bacterium]